MSLIATPTGAPLNKGMLRVGFDDARARAGNAATEAGDTDLAASETDLEHAAKLLAHTNKQITRTAYQPVGELVLPTK